MKKLVFLHGARADKNAYKTLMDTQAHHWNADLISFNAPFNHTGKIGKYKWFNKFENGSRRDAFPKEYEASLQYIKDYLNHLQVGGENIILIGHSQGGGMAVHVGLEMDLAGVISINGDLPYNITYSKRTNTPIYWFESDQDSYIDSNRKRSYQLISDNKNFHFFRLKNSTHNNFEDDFLKCVNDGLIKL